MKNIVKSIITSSIILSSSFVSAEGLSGYKTDPKSNQIQAELFGNLKNDEMNNIDSLIDARIITNAALRYFDEEVRLYKLKPETRKQVDAIMMSYLSQHPILKTNQKGEIRFVIDDKKEFSKMINQLTHTLLNGMFPFIRKIAVAFVFGGENSLQYQLDNLEASVRNMKSKQYKDVVFDYLGGILKIAILDINGKFNVKKYYDDINKYYPNKHASHIYNELFESGQTECDICDLKYPF